MRLLLLLSALLAALTGVPVARAIAPPAEVSALGASIDMAAERAVVRPAATVTAGRRRRDDRVVLSVPPRRAAPLYLDRPRE